MGGAFADALFGDGGNDILRGGGGDDRLDGGDGDGLLDGGAGYDLLSYAAARSGVSVSLAIAGAQNTLGGGTDTLTDIEDLVGSDFADLLRGSATANLLLGRADDDVLVCGGGVDQLDGGEGSDTYLLESLDDHLAAEIVDTGVGGTDEIRLTAAQAGTLILSEGDSGVERVVLGAGETSLNVDARLVPNALTIIGNNGVNTLEGTRFDDLLQGGGGDDRLGGGGNDRLEGGLGADEMRGGAGNDIYLVERAGDLVIELADEGTDLVIARVSYTLPDDVENLTLAGSGFLNGCGNALANLLTGNALANKLLGLAGDDPARRGRQRHARRRQRRRPAVRRHGRRQPAGRERRRPARRRRGRRPAGRRPWCRHAARRSRRGPVRVRAGRPAERTASGRGPHRQGEADRIDLSAIDADAVTAGDQGLTFLATAAFTGRPGELRYEQRGGSTFVEVGADGDRVADYLIQLDGLHGLSGSDFVL